MRVRTDPATLRDQVLEQVMRVTDDETLVVPFLGVQPRSRRAHTALGRLLSFAPVALVVGSPVMALVGGDALDPQWRTACPVASASLWSTFEFLVTMYGPADEGQDPYQALEQLRGRADAEMAT